MIATVLAALLSHWRRHPLQCATLLLGLSLATALWSAVQTINTEARASYARAAAMLGQDQLRQIVSDDGGLIDEAVYVRLRRAGIPVSPVVRGELRLGAERLRLVGIDPLSLPPQARQVEIEGGSGLHEFIRPPGIYFAAPETIERLKGKTGLTLRPSSALPPGQLVTDIGRAQQQLGWQGRISTMLLAEGFDIDAARLAAIAPGLKLRNPGAGGGDVARLTDSFHLNLTAFGFLSFAVGLFIVHAAIGLAFEQRRSTCRTLRALGVPLAILVLLMMAEMLVLAVIAGTLGVALGYGIAAALLPDVSATLKGLYGADVPGALQLRPVVLLAGILIAVAGTAVSTASGVWRVWRMSLLSSAQAEAWTRMSARTARLQCAAGLLALAAAAAIGLWGEGLTWGFALLGLLLMGAALLLPAFLGAVMGFGAARSTSATAQWAWADARQQLPGLSLALMALLMALATNVGVGTMVSSFRLTFTGWLDQRLASELYVTTRNETEARAVQAWLKQNADAVLPIWHWDGETAGQPIEILGIVDHATYRDNWPMIRAVPSVWDQVTGGKALLVNEQFWRRTGLDLGDTVTLTESLALPVAGIYSDYGNPSSQAIIAIDTLTRTYPAVERLRYAVRVAPERAAGLAAQLRDTFGLPPENVVDQAGIKAFSMRVFDRTFTVTGALNILTLGVAGMAMFASMLTLAGMRLPNLAPVWAMGLTTRELALIDLGRSAALAALTMIAAIPVGLALAWVLLSVVNVEAFGWQLPMYLFPLEWLKLGGLAILAALLAAAIPAWRLSRMAPAVLLKVFAHAR